MKYKIVFFRVLTGESGDLKLGDEKTSGLSKLEAQILVTKCRKNLGTFAEFHIAEDK